MTYLYELEEGFREGVVSQIGVEHDLRIEVRVTHDGETIRLTALVNGLLECVRYIPAESIERSYATRGNIGYQAGLNAGIELRKWFV